MAALGSTVGGAARAVATTYVYVSHAEDGDIGCYTLQADGSLTQFARVQVAAAVMPMAVSPDRRFLFAAVRSKPFCVHSFAIDAANGALKPVSVSPLAESFPYISLDRTGRYLFGASYGGHLISVNAVGADGTVGDDPLQVIPVGRNAHSIGVDATNRHVFVPCLGDDQIFQFAFDGKKGTLASNTPAAARMNANTGPRHFITSPDNRFVYVLSEFLATVTTFALDPNTGLLTELSSASGLPPDTKLVPGQARLPPGGPGSPPPRNRENDIWAADIHILPDGRFLFISERTSSTLNGFSVDRATGKLTYIGTTPTEKQPRGFAIDGTGRYMIVTGEKSETVSTYSIDAANGSLVAIGRYPAGRGATWVEIVDSG
jgi:6-phosphogluconolactonase